MIRIFIAFLAAGLVWVTAGCSEDKCKNVSCQNGGACVDGTCNCVNGFKGDRCQTAPTCKLLSEKDVFFYAWDGDKLTKITDDGGFELTFNYDASGKITSWSEKQGSATSSTGTITYGSSPEEILKIEFSDGSKYEHTYSGGKVVQCKYYSSSTASPTTTTYEYDANGNVTKLTEGTLTINYLYDTGKKNPWSAFPVASKLLFSLPYTFGPHAPVSSTRTDGSPETWSWTGANEYGYPTANGYVYNCN